MPRRDGTGPQGMGSMTGRGAGRCAGNNTPGRGANSNGGSGFGGCGAGRGRRNGFLATGLPGWMRFGLGGAAAAQPGDAERAALQTQAEMLERQLDDVKNRLNTLPSGGETKKP
ncbi:MAG: DUF5320 domain-containing protein [Candidatus Hydrogenedentes bacterium]|nr:DUF5320 domain-containing protein [Candidatus Hydrogenedentota bacterium]